MDTNQTSSPSPSTLFLLLAHLDGPSNPWGNVAPIFCRDGFRLSVQAGPYHHAYRASDGRVLEVEVGYPSQRVDALMPYVEDETRPTETVYAHVPVELVAEVIDAHGGIA